MKTIYISFDAEINVKTVEQLKAATFNFVQQGYEHIYYLISTAGGEVRPGISLYNTLKGLPVETTMHNVGAVDSIGNAIFLAGKNRYACKHSTFMFHGVGINPAQGTRINRTACQELIDTILADERKIAGIVANETSLKGEDIDSLFAQSVTRNVDFAIQNGFIGDVREVSIPKGAQVVQLVFQR
jgi:ATP-dependent protease ClpP protease subunit